MSDFVGRFTRTTVLVRSPEASRLADLLADDGATVDSLSDGSLVVGGADAAAVGELAASYGVVLHQLVTRTASLEEAFLSATGAAEEYRGVSTHGSAA